MINDLQARHMDTIVFTNNVTERDEPDLSISDRLGFNVIYAPHEELYRDWWADTVPATIARARSVIYPVVDRIKIHPSVHAYNILDDATDHYATKVRLAYQAFKERDPQTPVSPVYIGGQDEVYKTARTNAFLTYVYPVVETRPPCDFFFRSSGQEPVDVSGTAWDFAQAIRALQKVKDPTVPLWIILQTHGATRVYNPGGDPSTLREPTVQEVRLQHWLALGENVQGISWFIYSTQQFWRGLVDNPALYAEVTDLASRLQRYKVILTTLKKVDDRFGASSLERLQVQYSPYVSTLVGAGGEYYVIAVNRSCVSQMIAVDSSTMHGTLKDLETEELFGIGSFIPFRGGDGRMFALVNQTATSGSGASS